MPQPTGVHVVRNWRGKWIIKLAGQHHTQADAEGTARYIARVLNAELIVHGVSGRFRKRNSYGHDPRARKG